MVYLPRLALVGKGIRLPPGRWVRVADSEPLLVVFSDPLADVPADTRVRLLKALEDVAATLSEVPAFSLVWDSLEAAPLQLDFEGWRFIYTVSREKGHLRVREHKLRGITPTSVRKRSHR